MDIWPAIKLSLALFAKSHFTHIRSEHTKECFSKLRKQRAKRFFFLPPGGCGVNFKTSDVYSILQTILKFLEACLGNTFKQFVPTNCK